MKNCTKMKCALIVTLILSAGYIQLYADTITLKNKTTVVGKIIGQNAEEIQVLSDETQKTVTVKRADIADIVTLKNQTTILGKTVSEGETYLQFYNADTKRVVTIKRTDIQEIRPAIGKDAQTLAAEAKGDLLFKLRPRLGTFQGAIIPISDIAVKLGVGYYGTIFFDLRMPVNNPGTNPFAFRLGLDVGYAWMTTDSGDATINMITTLVYTDLSYTFMKVGLGLFLRVGGGISIPMLEKEEDTGIIEKTSIDGTIMAGIGLTYHIPKIPQLEIFADFNYLIGLETINGQYMTFGLGVSYQFYTLRGASK